MINRYFYLEERWKGTSSKDMSHQVGALKRKAMKVIKIQHLHLA